MRYSLRQGLSFMEALLAISIFGIVVTTGVVFLRVTLLNYTDIVSHQHRVQQVEYVLQRLEQELGSAFVGSVSVQSHQKGIELSFAPVVFYGWLTSQSAWYTRSGDVFNLQLTGVFAPDAVTENVFRSYPVTLKGCLKFQKSYGLASLSPSRNAEACTLPVRQGLAAEKSAACIDTKTCLARTLHLRVPDGGADFVQKNQNSIVQLLGPKVSYWCIPNQGQILRIEQGQKREVLLESLGGCQFLAQDFPELPAPAIEVKLSVADSRFGFHLDRQFWLKGS